VIRRNHGVELAAHGAHKDRVGGKGAGDFRFPRRGSKKLGVLVAKSSRVTAVWVEGAESDARLGDPQPVLQAVAGDPCRIDDCRASQCPRHISERQVRSHQHHSQLVRGQHHRHVRFRQRRQHLGVSRIIVSTGVQRGLIDWSGNDTVNFSGSRHRRGALDGKSTQPSRVSRRAPR